MHLATAHNLWKKLVRPADWVVDATCGAGLDALILSKLAGRLTCLDIQPAAIERTGRRLAGCSAIVDTYCQCHSQWPDLLQPESIQLIVYNLGYLPSSDRKVRTRVDTTLASVEGAMRLIRPGGALSIMCYPGHAEGAEEEKALVAWTRSLPNEWLVHYQCFDSASLLWITYLGDAQGLPQISHNKEASATDD